MKKRTNVQYIDINDIFLNEGCLFLPTDDALLEEDIERNGIRNPLVVCPTNGRLPHFVWQSPFKNFAKIA